MADVFKSASLEKAGSTGTTVFDVQLVPHAFDEAKAGVFVQYGTLDSAALSEQALCQDAPLLMAQAIYADTLLEQIGLGYRRVVLTRRSKAMAQTFRAQQATNAEAVTRLLTSVDWPRELELLFEEVQATWPALATASWGQAAVPSVATLMLADAALGLPESVWELEYRYLSRKESVSTLVLSRLSPFLQPLREAAPVRCLLEVQLEQALRR